MKVKLHPVDHSGCAYYRMRMPGEAARGEGVQVKIDPHIPLVAADRPAAVDADVLVFQRPAQRAIVELLPKYQAMGYAVVIEIDDNMQAIPVEHPSYDHFVHGERANRSYIKQACALADFVTVSTPALAEGYAPHGRVAVLPNCVPRRILDLPRESDGHTVGWAGAVVWHPGDLGVIGTGLADALEDWRFLLIGPDVDEVAKQLGLTDMASAHTESTGGLSIGEYHEALGRLDLGVAPLIDSRFNDSKSALKGLEYAARGVPFVASPTPEYRALGLGYLAMPRSRSWRSALRQLKMDESLRAEFAEQGRAEVRAAHTYEGEGWRWPEAWEQALRHRRTKVPSRPKLKREEVPEPPHQSTDAPLRVAVLMTVYEAGEFLQQAIDSVLGQTHADFELLVMDDGSADPEVARILSEVTDERVTVARSYTTPEQRRESCRYATLINWGAEHTTAPYITYLCGDDFYLPDRLERMLSRLHDGLDVVYGAQQLFDEAGVHRGTRDAKGVLEDASERVDLNSVMHTRVAFEHVGGWDDSPGVWRNADAHFWRRLTDAGYLFEPVEGPPTDAKRYRRAGVDARVTEGKLPWLEREEGSA